ncbi:AAA family ATPase [Nocardia aurantia]|uniref:DNA replication and repair protein RecF n=1 Tax=Nocardia aurantia TaxID=2585199 RepID=A0A7K0E0W5_9NOCA|nr:AAA family ATPase [Nocardia aurantia]MQY31730.1 DNA replication and repair protein RecF [Nocardia aurantia]
MSEPGDWHIDRLELENFRCFERLDVALDPSLTVLVGANGTGKTAVLDALAVMLSTVVRQFNGGTRGFGIEDAREVPRDLDSRAAVARMDAMYPVRASVEATLAGSKFRWQRERASEKGRTSWGEKNSQVGQAVARIWHESDALENAEGRPLLLPVVALYGVERLLGVRKAMGAIARSRSGAYDSALDGKSDLSRLSRFIEALTLADFVADTRGEDALAARNQLKAITLACNTMLKDTGWQDPTWNPIVDGLTLRHRDRGELPLSFLSSGIKIAAGLVIDLVSRIARANPALGAEDLLAAVPGIVLIDEIDLHLHPTWQQRIIPLFAEVFPRVQFVVTTHSPQVLSTVEAGSIRVLDDTEVRTVQYSAGLRSDVVLAQVMGTDPEPRLAINDKLDEYLELVDRGQGRSEAAMTLRRRLDEELGGITNVPQLADADASIAFFDMDD